MTTKRWHPFDEDYGDPSPECPRCGSDCEFQDCDACGGEGSHDFAEDDPIQYGPSDVVPCDMCDGQGGWWRCVSSYEWCQANPLPGHEDAKRAA